jgi:hypothetical protein
MYATAARADEHACDRNQEPRSCHLARHTGGAPSSDLPRRATNTADNMSIAVEARREPRNSNAGSSLGNATKGEAPVGSRNEDRAGDFVKLARH